MNASIASALGSGFQAKYNGNCVFILVANKSMSGLLKVSQMASKICFLSIHSMSLFTTALLSASAVAFSRPGRYSADKIMFLSRAHCHMRLVSSIKGTLLLAFRLMQATAVEFLFH